MSKSPRSLGAMREGKMRSGWSGFSSNASDHGTGRPSKAGVARLPSTPAARRPKIAGQPWPEMGTGRPRLRTRRSDTHRL